MLKVLIKPILRPKQLLLCEQTERRTEAGKGLVDTRGTFILLYSVHTVHRIFFLYLSTNTYIVIQKTYSDLEEFVMLHNRVRIVKKAGARHLAIRPIHD
jgi:hypothetical protein